MSAKIQLRIIETYDRLHDEGKLNIYESVLKDNAKTTAKITLNLCDC